MLRQKAIADVSNAIGGNPYARTLTPAQTTSR